MLEVDGGIKTPKQRLQAVKAGADVLVAGSFVFSSDDMKATVAEIKAL